MVKELEGEHTSAGDMLKELQRLTDDYTLPDDACATYAQTYRIMKAFTEDVFVHVFKENSITFPEYAEQK
jgi:regulator of cell morphogenesis and NO signaling